MRSSKNRCAEEARRLAVISEMESSCLWNPHRCLPRIVHATDSKVKIFKMVAHHNRLRSAIIRLTWASFWENRLEFLRAGDFLSHRQCCNEGLVSLLSMCSLGPSESQAMWSLQESCRARHSGFKGSWGVLKRTGCGALGLCRMGQCPMRSWRITHFGWWGKYTGVLCSLQTLSGKTEGQL